MRNDGASSACYASASAIASNTPTMEMLLIKEMSQAISTNS